MKIETAQLFLLFYIMFLFQVFAIISIYLMVGKRQEHIV